MASDYLAGKVQVIALGVALSGMLFQEGEIIPVRNKADILAVPLFGVQKPFFLSNFPDLLFGQLPQRKQGVGKLMLVQAVEKISLILRPVRCLIQ